MRILPSMIRSKTQLHHVFKMGFEFGPPFPTYGKAAHSQLAALGLPRVSPE